MKRVVYAGSIREAVTNGKLVELSSDYRTSGAVRATLPPETSYASTVSVFNQHIREGGLAELDARIDAFCRDLRRAIDAHGHGLAPADFLLAQRGPDGQVKYHALKLSWLAASSSWVVSLPDEEVRMRTASR